MDSTRLSSGQPVDSVHLSTERPVSSGQRPVVIIDKGTEYTRDSHPKLFAVVDWLEDNPGARDMPIRAIADAFKNATDESVSKSWVAVAKRYWESQSA